MGQVVEAFNQNDQPRQICPHCKKIFLIDITPWKNNVTQILKTNCTKCGGQVFVGMLLLSSADLRNLVGNIQSVVDLFNKGQANVLLGTKK